MLRRIGWSRSPIKLWLVTVALLVTIILPDRAPSLQAAQFSDGSTMFDSPPRLVSFTTTRDRVGERDAVYNVTVELLPEAGEPLKTLQVALLEGRFRRLNYRLDDIEVFEGDRSNRGATLAIESIDYEAGGKTLTVRMADAIAPGQLITFALKPVRNPAREGVYLFDVSAAPDGDRPVYQRVGTGRLNIFRSDGRDPFD